MNNAYLRNGVAAEPKPTYAQLIPRCQPAEQRVQHRLTDDRVRDTYKERHKAPLIPSAAHPHDRRPEALKPYVRPTYPRYRDAPEPPEAKTMGMKATQGFARNQRKGLAFLADGRNHIATRLMKQADSNYAYVNNPIPLPA